jgi:hypothetical protein
VILSAFTLFHVVLSLVGIGSGFVVLYGLLTSKQSDRWTTVFLATTLGASVTGFLFPFQHFMPSHGVGIVSVVLLAVAIPARYVFQLAAAWGRVYGVTAVIALYLNVFVLIAQLFQKVPLLKAMAPTQSEPPFLMAQLVLLVLFTVLAIRVSIRTRKEQLRTA